MQQDRSYMLRIVNCFTYAGVPQERLVQHIAIHLAPSLCPFLEAESPMREDQATWLCHLGRHTSSGTPYKPLRDKSSVYILRNGALAAWQI